jgi:NitT/TauT family transport system permease protein
MSFRSLPFTWITTPALIVLFILAWDLYVTWFEISKFILPRPISVFDGLVDLFSTPSTYKHTWVTIYETLAGFAIAATVGVGLGAVLGKVPWLERTLNPFIIATQVVPKVALIPLFILWFGFGPESKIIISAVIAFFPILTNTLLGVKSVDFGQKDVLTSLNASKWQTFVTLEFPSALPAILTGMEVGIVLAIIGAVVGEYLGGSQGLGYLAVATLAAYKVNSLFAVIILLTAVGFLLYMAMVGVRRFIIPWHESVLIERQQAAG